MASGVTGGGAGAQAHPQNIWFVESFGKIPEDLGKIPENLGKIPKNLGKIPENPGRNGAQRCVTSNNGAQWLSEKQMNTFFLGVHTK